MEILCEEVVTDPKITTQLQQNEDNSKGYVTEVDFFFI